MLLRVSVLRYQLPAVKFLYFAPVSQEPLPVSKLLELVDQLVPLKSDNWSLDDYFVSCGDYECLHYSDCRSILKENDEIIIRYLTTHDFRTRRLAGRYQIAQSGARLIDGIPFGRTFLGRTARPGVFIPPGKGTDDVPTETILDGTKNDARPREQAQAPPAVQPAEAHSRPDGYPDIDNGEEDDDVEDGDFDANSVSSMSTSSMSSSSVSSPSSSSESSSSDDVSIPTDSEDEEVRRQQRLAKRSIENAGKPDGKKIVRFTNGESQHRPVPPGQGKAQTRARNKRRRNSRRIVQSKKDQLLNAVALMDVSQAGAGNNSLDDATQADKVVDNGPVDSFHERIPQDIYTVPEAFDTHKNTSDTLTSKPPSQRSRLDPKASRRLIFGSLGVKNPKNAQEEEQLRQRLGKRGRPNGYNGERPDELERSNIRRIAEASQVEEDLWKMRISLHAVECAEERIDLPIPSYPFNKDFARDVEETPYAEGRKRKRRRRNRDNPAESLNFVEHTYSPSAGSEQSPNDIPIDDTNTADLAADFIEHEPSSAKEMANLHAERDAILHAKAEEKRQRYAARAAAANNSSNAHDEAEDLPLPPSDPTTLPLLTNSTIKPDQIITFTQLEVSKKTKWQPQRSPLRTAKVLSVRYDNPDYPGEADVDMVLSRRDKPRSHRERNDSGKLLYDDFEAPDGESGDEADGTGDQQCQFSALFEPRVLVDVDDAADGLGCTNGGRGSGGKDEDATLNGVGGSVNGTNLVPDSLGSSEGPPQQVESASQRERQGSEESEKAFDTQR